MFQYKNSYTLFFGLILIGIFAVFFISSEDVDNETEDVNKTATSTEEKLSESKEESSSGDSSNLVPPPLDRPVPSGTDTGIVEKILALTNDVRANDADFGVWLDLASYRKVAGDIDGAKEIWIFMTKKFPFEIAPHINLGDLYHFNEKNYSLAEREYATALSLNPTYFPLYLDIYEFYRYSYTEKAHLADDALLDGLALGPSELPLLATLGAYYEETGDSKKAIEYYQKTADEALLVGDIDTRTRYLQKISTLEVR